MFILYIIDKKNHVFSSVLPAELIENKNGVTGQLWTVTYGYKPV